MNNDARQVLSEAIARNCGLVLSLPSAGMLRHHKSRFLAEEEGGFWAESVAGEGALLDELLATGKPVGISFRSGTNKIVFASPLRRREPQFAINAELTLEAVLVAFPEEVKTIQRRNNYRVRVLPDSNLFARVWRITERAHLSDRVSGTAEVKTEVKDISVGGLGVTFLGKEGNPPKISEEDRLRIELVYKDVPLLLEGRMRKSNFVAPADGSLRTGICFKALEGDLEGRQKLSQLNRILGELQREEIRRCRLGLAS